MSTETLSFSENVCSVGGVYYNNPCSFKELLAKADTALAVSKHEGPNAWYLEAADCDEDHPLQGKVWWRENLEQSLAERAINLYGQHVVQTDAPDVPLHMELYSRITIDREREVPAGVFIPLAERAEVARAVREQAERIEALRDEIAAQPAPVDQRLIVGADRRNHPSVEPHVGNGA
mgnify:CR=1 FL=1